MKVFYYLVFVLIIGSCSVESEETSTATDYGTSDGSASSPVELTVGTAKEGSFAKYGTAITSSHHHQQVREVIS